MTSCRMPTSSGGSCTLCSRLLLPEARFLLCEIPAASRAPSPGSWPAPPSTCARFHSIDSDTSASDVPTNTTSASATSSTSDRRAVISNSGKRIGLKITDHFRPVGVAMTHQTAFGLCAGNVAGATAGFPFAAWKKQNTEKQPTNRLERFTSSKQAKHAPSIHPSIHPFRSAHFEHPSNTHTQRTQQPSWRCVQCVPAFV